MARVVRNCDVVFKSSVMLCRLTRHYPQANYARRLLPSYRHFSSILPKFPFDPKEWPSTLPSTKGVVNLETLQAQLQKAGVKYLAPSFLDMHGIPKTKMVPVDHLISCSRGSELFTGAALDGVPQAISDDEVCAVADPTTMAVQLPYQREVCYMPASLYYHGTPFESCSRNIYARVAERAKAKGFLMKLGIEAEFFVLRDDDEEGNMRSSRFKPPKQEPISALETMHHPVYDLSRLIDNLPWMGQLVDAMNELGWGVYSFDHEDAVGQFEVDFQFCEAGLMADRFVLLRMMTCAIAREHGSYASWMPKPMQNRTGSGAHLNVSLHDFNDDKEINLFRPSSDNTSDGQEESEQLSELGRYFLGGVMAHLDAITAVTCPSVNSYKRMIWTPPSSTGNTAGFTWAPVYASYGSNNRTNAVRVPAKGRFEIRASDSAVNPHLAAALVLAAGLEGIEQQIDPGPSRGHDNLFESGDKEGAKLLPRNLGEAIDAFDADPLAKSVFGDSMHKAYVDFKRTEYSDYCKHVSEWEVKRYLRQFG